MSRSLAHILVALWLASLARCEYGYPVLEAIAVLSGTAGVNGTVTFTQEHPFAQVNITGEIRNLTANAKRGFHVHQFGDLSNGCTSAGAHFNPFNKTHGAPTDANRHLGDLGNVQSDASGIANFTFSDSQISLYGPNSILGRSLVVHSGEDDLGRGGNETSLTTGNSGSRLACGVIGFAETT